MEPLFRLMLARPAIAQDPKNPSIRLSQNTPYQVALLRLTGSGNRQGLKDLAKKFIETDDFLGSPSDTPLAEQLAAFSEALDDLENEDEVNPGDLSRAIKDHFGTEPA